MLLRRTGDGVFAITQPAHAWLSGVMAGAWGNARFDAPEPRQEICLAAGLHDIGWLDWERAPQFDPQTGWPRVFADVPAEEHTQLWKRGVEHVATASRYAAILVSMHGDTIYDKTFDPATARPAAAEAVRRFRAEGAAFRQQAVAALRGDPILVPNLAEAQLTRAKKLIAALDTLSLQLCWGAERAEIPDVPTRSGEAVVLTLARAGGGEGGERVSLDPWPFSLPSVTLHLETLPLIGPFGDRTGMEAGLAQAKVATLAITLQPR